MPNSKKQLSQKGKFLSLTQKKGLPIKAMTNMFLGVDTTALLNRWVEIYEHNCAHRGRPEAIKFMKILYNQAVNYSLYEEVSEIPFRKTIRKNSLIICELKPFVPYLRGNVPKTRAALTVLRQFEMLYDEPSYDISTVTSLPTCYNDVLKARFIFWLRRRRRLPVINIGTVSDHLSSKKGPSGLAAMNSWDLDAINLPENILEAIKRLSTIWGDPGFSARIDRIRDIVCEDHQTQKVETCSRLQVFTAGGGKTRIIAIYDYWSQRVLKPLHQAVFKNLKTINEDSTFGHESAADWLKKLPKEEDVYCYDLTAATDRIPMWIHQNVLHTHLPKRTNRREIVKLWTTIMNDRDFTLAWDHSKTVRYKTGQPMGAYSSWAFLAYSHHCIARFCGARKNGYRIIGDDIVILGKAGRIYKKFMTSFGIEISQAKSIISYKNSTHRTGEVAKRLILDGLEISPPTPKLIYRTFKDYRLTPMLLQDIVNRGWKIRTSSVLAFVNLFSKNWADKLITVLTFPVTNSTRAHIREVLVDHSPWKKYNTRELMYFYIRYRLHLLNKTLTSLTQGDKLFNPYTVLAGATLGEQPRTELYDLSPIPLVRRNMVVSILQLVNRLDDYMLRFDNLSNIEIADALEIKEVELYVPDISLEFLDIQYQRQKFQSNVLINLRTHIEKGTIHKLMEIKIPSNLDPRLSRACGP